MRGVGQTTNLIYNLPNERCIVVAINSNIVREIEKRIIELRGKDFAKKVKVICITDDDHFNKIRGYSHLIFFDHSFFLSGDEELAKKAIDYANSSAVVYHTHKGNFK